MSTIEETIRLDTVVVVELTGFGRHLLDRSTESEATIEYEAALGRARGGHAQDVRAKTRPTTVAMPLWEVLRVFGPHVKSCVRWPFKQMTFERQRTEAERDKHDNEQRLASIVRRFAQVMVKIGASRPDCYDLKKDAACWLEQAPPRVPDAPGFWWRGDRVERVVWAGTGSCRHLAVQLRNNRTVNVEAYDQDQWMGPAVRDPRVKLAIADHDDEDIPF